ncbi:unnamed protein product [Staurois parvus]|uniref:Uncharacterized protein n=1 Tax=Staurois parvus TaxID=386267 RepID=A0ABN9GWA8_9NEOB|nr:unnamed protein product [Staurois parvus]
MQMQLYTEIDFLNSKLIRLANWVTKTKGEWEFTPRQWFDELGAHYRADGPAPSMHY